MIAYVVPLSLLAVIVAIAILAFLYHRRKSTTESRAALIPVDGRRSFAEDPLPWQAIFNGVATRKPPTPEKDIFTSVYRSPPSQRPPREITRSVYITGHSIAPGRIFKSSLSPRLPSLPQTEDVFRVGSQIQHAKANASIVSHFVLPSPVPSRTPITDIPSVPPKLHIRRGEGIEPRDSYFL